MVNLLTGQKGSGKTQQLIEAANAYAKECDGVVVFIKKTHNDTTSLDFSIRTACMDDYPAVKTTEGYLGFIYGMYNANSDIECVFIDGILKHADIELENVPAFVDSLDMISKSCGIKFYVSISAEKEDLADVDPSKFTFI